MKIQSLLEKCGIDCDIEEVLEGKKYQIRCPVAEWTHEKGRDSHPSAVVALSKETGAPYFHCFTCKTSGSLADLAYDFADYSGDVKLRREALQSFPELQDPHVFRLMGLRRKLREVPELSTRIDHANAFNEQCCIIMEGSGAAKYLRERCIRGKLVDRYGLRYDKKNKRVVLPVYDKSGILLTAVGRALHKDQVPKYYNYYTAPTGTLLGGISLYDSKKHTEIVVVEGYFDMLNLARYRKTVLPICCFGARLTDEQAKQIADIYYSKTILQRPQVTLMYDGDKAGREATVSAAKKLVRRKVPLSAIWLPPDQDPGGLSKSQYLYYLGSSKKWLSHVRRKKQQQESSLQKILKAIRTG